MFKVTVDFDICVKKLTIIFPMPLVFKQDIYIILLSSHQLDYSLQTSTEVGLAPGSTVNVYRYRAISQLYTCSSITGPRIVHMPWLTQIYQDPKKNEN